MPPRREPPRKRVSATYTGSSPEEVQQALYRMLKKREEDPLGGY
jgi:multidrug efflux pump subunit AcrB